MTYQPTSQREAAIRAVLLERASRYQEPGALAAFVRLMWAEIEPSRLQWAPYIDVVCDVLQRQALGDPEVRNLLVMLPPGFAKSLLVSVMAPAFEWLFNPTRRKLFFSAGDTVNERDSRRCRNLLNSPTYQELLGLICEREGRPPWYFAKDQNKKRNYENSAKGFRQVLTIRSGVTGNRGDDIVVDDPIDAKDVILGTMEAINKRLKEVNDTYDQVISSRLNRDPDRPSRRTIVMQRLASNDLVGHLAKTDHDGWYILCLPFRYEPDHPNVCDLDPRTRAGELLHPDRYTEEEADATYAQLGSQAMAQLQMRPVPKGGGMVKRSHLRHWGGVSEEAAALECAELVLSIDPAEKAADDNDFYGFQLWGKLATGRMRLIWRLSKRMEFPDFVAEMDRVMRRWAPIMRQRPSCIVCEETANGTPWIQATRGMFFGIPVVGFVPSRDTPGKDKSKPARFLYFQRATEARLVEVPEYGSVSWNLDEVVDQWCAFPRVDHDDDCDPASMVALRWMTGTASPGRDSPAQVLGRLQIRGARRSGRITPDDIAF